MADDALDAAYRERLDIAVEALRQISEYSHHKNAQHALGQVQNIADSAYKLIETEPYVSRLQPQEANWIEACKKQGYYDFCKAKSYDAQVPGPYSEAFKAGFDAGLNAFPPAMGIAEAADNAAVDVINYLIREWDIMQKAVIHEALLIKVASLIKQQFKEKP